MKNKYCFNCGKEVLESKNKCGYCDTNCIELPKSKEEKEFVDKINKQQKENPPSKLKGCLATLLIFSFMFGVPAVLAYNNISFDNIYSKIVVILLIVLLNVVLYKLRGKIKYSKYRYYNLEELNEKIHLEKSCRKCGQSIKEYMIFCPKCGLHTHEDLPVDLSTKISKVFCTVCGGEVTNKKFCPECGNKVEVN